MTQEILIGVERRRRWSDERKLAILAEVGVDGASVSDVARRHDLSRQHLYQWRTSFRQRLSSPDQSVAFVPVASVTTPAVASGGDPAERAIRPVCVGRKNYLFAGSDAGGDNIADAMTLIESAKLSGLNPQDYLADVLARINEHKINRLHELLPWNWKPVNTPHRHAA